MSPSISLSSNVRRIASCLLIAGIVFAAARVSAQNGSTTDCTPDQALERLRDGNARFVAGKSAAHTTLERRTELAGGQHPFAIILACADSRLSPEIIFDQGLGEVFVIRNAGNLLDDHVIGSIEYAVEHLHSTLIVVLGHTKCGAVTAAVAGGEAPGHLRSIVESLEPAVVMARKKPGDALDNAIRINAKLAAAALNQSEPLLRRETKAGTLKVVAARYDLASGAVEFLP